MAGTHSSIQIFQLPSDAKVDLTKLEDRKSVQGEKYNPSAKYRDSNYPGCYFQWVPYTKEQLEEKHPDDHPVPEVRGKKVDRGAGEWHVGKAFAD